MDRLVRVQQSAALPVAVVAAAGGLLQNGAPPWNAGLLVAGTVILVAAVVIAAIGLQKNRSQLADSAQLKDFVDAGWTDDDLTARYNVVIHQIKQMKDLDEVCDQLHVWAVKATWTQMVGLVIVGAGGASLLIP
ncbi:MAG: hypothetical protein WA892_04725 [Ornithinimicrobium sp.]